MSYYDPNDKTGQALWAFILFTLTYGIVRAVIWLSERYPAA